MRKKLAALTLCLCVPLLASCSKADQVENLAYGIILGLDRSEDGVELSVQIPKISSPQKDGGSGGSGTDYLIYSATGARFEEALKKLRWAVPRPLDLSQLRLIVVSEAIARSDRFLEAADAIMDVSRLYTAARLAICTGGTKAFLEAENQAIGSRVSTDLGAMFESYAKEGFIPDVTFADVYYRTISIYSDPLAIYATTLPSADTPQSAPATAMIMPGGLGDESVESQQDNRFFGAVVLREGVMVGTLEGDDLLCCNLLSGDSQAFSFALGDDVVSLAAARHPDVDIAWDASGVAIHVDLYLTALPASSVSDLTGLEDALRARILRTVDACKAMDVEPFRFAETAAQSFATIDAWRACDWRTQFRNADVDVRVHVGREDR